MNLMSNEEKSQIGYYTNWHVLSSTSSTFTPYSDMSFLGVSTGAVVACCICVYVSSKQMTDIMKDFNERFIQLGPSGYYKLIHQLGGILERVLPDDAHEICNGRLVVGITSIEIGRPRWLITAFLSTFFRSGPILGTPHAPNLTHRLANF